MSTATETTTEPKFSITTHNGTITAFNPETGQHRTFRIRTQKQDARFAPGQRILGLLTGPDNTSDYTGFAFVSNDGRVHLWRSKIGTQFEKLANFIAQADYWAAHGIQFEWSAKCRRCNRDLTDWNSLMRGIGPTCAGIEE